MSWKMENPNKVKNLVDGQINELLDIYSPIINEFEKRNWLKVIERKDDHV